MPLDCYALVALFAIDASFVDKKSDSRLYHVPLYYKGFAAFIPSKIASTHRNYFSSQIKTLLSWRDYYSTYAIMHGACLLSAIIKRHD